MRTTRLLEAHDWLDAGLELLRVRGIGGVQVGPLCRRVGVTKGSFYHFFSNRAVFHEQLIERWQEITSIAPAQQTEFVRLPSLEHRIRALLDFIREHELLRYDLAMRTWARADTKAQTAVAAIDSMRVATTAKLFEADGWSPQAARARARIMRYFIAGCNQIEGRAPSPEEGAEFARTLSRLET